MSQCIWSLKVHLHCPNLNPHNAALALRGLHFHLIKLTVGGFVGKDRISRPVNERKGI